MIGKSSNHYALRITHHIPLHTREAEDSYHRLTKEYKQHPEEYTRDEHRWADLCARKEVGTILLLYLQPKAEEAKGRPYCCKMGVIMI
ncbi:MAG TPA: hypothetical protein VGN63_20775 [Flavisolibacter sp.]|jgi:hypothetical protein|nr:hypothetical protein [Flavisolibacter sp.]